MWEDDNVPLFTQESFVKVSQLLCVAAADSATPVLFEDPRDVEKLETTMLGDCCDPSQQAFANLLRGLFHWKLDTTEGRAYSLLPNDYLRLPLYKKHQIQTVGHVFLNEVFWLVYDNMSDAPTPWGVGGGACHSMTAREWRTSRLLQNQSSLRLLLLRLEMDSRLFRKYPSTSLPTSRAWWLWPPAHTVPLTLVPQGWPRESQT